MNQIASNGSLHFGEPTNAGPIFIPPADILENKNTILVVLDVPGADPESLDVTLEKRVLTVRARLLQPPPEGYAPAVIEFREGTYERRFVFAEQMDGNQIDARLKDGVLRLAIPKATGDAVKKISVKAE